MVRGYLLKYEKNKAYNRTRIELLYNFYKKNKTMLNINK